MDSAWSATKASATKSCGSLWEALTTILKVSINQPSQKIILLLLGVYLLSLTYMKFDQLVTSQTSQSTIWYRLTNWNHTDQYTMNWIYSYLLKSALCVNGRSLKQLSNPCQFSLDWAGLSQIYKNYRRSITLWVNGCALQPKWNKQSVRPHSSNENITNFTESMNETSRPPEWMGAWWSTCKVCWFPLDWHDSRISRTITNLLLKKHCPLSGWACNLSWKKLSVSTRLAWISQTETTII